MMSVFDDPAFDDHERVLFCRDEPTGLFAIIALHSTLLGPAGGGCRLWGYTSTSEALHDVLRLSKAMSYKNAMAGLKFGGGKAVIVKTSEFVATDSLFERYGTFVDSLNGSYVTAEDVGMTPEVMLSIARKTRYVCGLPAKDGRAGGDSAINTAYGVFCGMEAAAKIKLGSANLAGVRVAVQGLGSVGYNLCKRLYGAGAALIVSDIDSKRAERACADFSATAVAPDQILSQEVEIFAPCALGAILNEKSIPMLKSQIVAGAANNQLATDADGQRLADAGILYAPDYVINAGGMINITGEYYGEWDARAAQEQTAKIGPRLAEIFEESMQSGKSTSEIADKRARKLISRG